MRKLALLPLLIISGLLLTRTCSSQPLHPRWNQTGLSPTQPVDVILLSESELPLQGWKLRSESRSISLTASPAPSLNQFFAYRVTGSRLPAGEYQWDPPVRAELPNLKVNQGISKDLILHSLRFFEAQRCGTTKNLMRHACHLRPGFIAGSPPKTRDLSGGWHDAGDYIKFTLTGAFTTQLLLQSVQMTKDPELRSSLLAEADWGLRWLEKTWRPGEGILSQIGDATDHESWRLPAATDKEPAQKVYLTSPGSGANLAGKIAASFALAAGKPEFSAEARKRYQRLAIEIFAWGEKNPKPQSSTDGFYNEETWRDDMALAALELYQLTKRTRYLQKARAWLRQEGNGWVFSYDRTHALAFYKWGLYDKTSRAEALRYLKQELASARENSAKHLFGEGLSEFYWGSSLPMMGFSLAALFHERLGGGAEFRGLAELQRDYLLGRNPWGVSFLANRGWRWAESPHHQIADLGKKPLQGSWNAGPMPRTAWQQLKIRLSKPDPGAAFQTERALFHDDKNDYATNEPTLTANATGILMLMSFLSVEGL